MNKWLFILSVFAALLTGVAAVINLMAGNSFIGIFDLLISFLLICIVAINKESKDD